MTDYQTLTDIDLLDAYVQSRFTLPAFAPVPNPLILLFSSTEQKQDAKRTKDAFNTAKAKANKKTNALLQELDTRGIQVSGWGCGFDEDLHFIDVNGRKGMRGRYLLTRKENGAGVMIDPIVKASADKKTMTLV